MLISQQITAADSHDAHVRSGKAQAQRDRIVAFVRSSGKDWSIGELADALGMEKSTVSARLNESLYETHELVERPRRKDRCSRVLIRPVGIPQVGQMGLFQ